MLRPAADPHADDRAERRPCRARGAPHRDAAAQPARTDAQHRRARQRRQSAGELSHVRGGVHARADRARAERHPRAARRTDRLPRTLKLEPHEIHVWLAFDREIDDPVALAAWEAWLAPEELARRARLRAPHLPHQYLVTRALLRS